MCNEFVNQNVHSKFHSHLRHLSILQPGLPPPPPPPPTFDTAIKLKVAHSIDHDSTMAMHKTESSAPENQSTSNCKNSGGLLGDIKNFKKEGILKKVTPDMIAKPKVEKRTPGNAAELLAQFMDARVSKNFPSSILVGTIKTRGLNYSI